MNRIANDNKQRADPSKPSVSPLAGKAVTSEDTLDVARLIDSYYSEQPDPEVALQAIAFGTSGHRGSAPDKTFNEHHVLAITQAICRYREAKGIDGPLFLGIDTHALSLPAVHTALEVLAGNRVETMIAGDEQFTPTPVISHAIIAYNRTRDRWVQVQPADGWSGRR